MKILLLHVDNFDVKMQIRRKSMRIIGKTEKGPVRAENEDAFRVVDLGKNSCFAVVCDGMGGEAGGRIASEIATTRITEVVKEGYREEMESRHISDLLKTAIASANIMIYNKAKKNPELQGMGTTAVVCIIRDDIAYIVHVGDSRAYLVGDRTINQITVDHTIVQVYLEQGKITEEEAQNHPRKHLITRALGVDEEVHPDYYEISIEPEESVLICSDGLTNYFDNQDLLLETAALPRAKWVDDLIAGAIERGGNDNVTVVLLTR